MNSALKSHKLSKFSQILDSLDPEVMEEASQGIMLVERGKLIDQYKKLNQSQESFS